MTFSPSDFRHCLGRFATGISVIITQNNKIEKQGVTVNSFCSVSLEPPMILFCLDANSSVHPAFTENNDFTVNILSAGQEEISRLFSQPTQVNWNNVAFKEEAGLVLEDCLAYLQCKVAERHAGGDHTVILAHVKNVWTDTTKVPLLYYRGQYHQIGDTL